MHNLGDQGQRLQRSWSKFFEQKKFGEVVQVAFISHGEHCAKTFQIDVSGSHFMMTRQLQVARFMDGYLWFFMGDLQ